MKLALGDAIVTVGLDLGPPVIFLHAFPLDGRMWAPQLEVVKELGFTPLTVNAPGFGGSSLLGLCDMERYADNAYAVWQALELPPAVVVGLSMGGYAALRITQRHPEMLRGLVLANTKAEADTPEAAAGRRQTARRILDEGSAVLYETLLPKLVHAPSPALRSKLEVALAEAPPEAVAAALRGMAIRPDSRQLLADITVPTLVIGAEHDPLTPPTLAESLAEGIPGAGLTVIPGVGHLSNLEAPEVFNAALRGFLQRLA
ncbi:MAG: alpha/beta fold hydrolase [Truepera sp.]|nr:alpha/beta fold hydrolase [Truepera sp.]